MSIVAKRLLKLGAKYLSGLATIGTIGYLSCLDKAVGNELEEIKCHQAKIAALTLNVANLEYHQVEGQFNRVIHQQGESMLKQEIAEFSIRIKGSLGEIAARHHHLQKLRPTKELT